MAIIVTIPSNTVTSTTANFILPPCPTLEGVVVENTTNGQKLTAKIVPSNAAAAASVVITTIKANGVNRYALTYSPVAEAKDDVTLASKLAPVRSQLLVEGPTSIEVTPQLYVDTILTMLAVLVKDDVVANKLVATGKIKSFLASVAKI